MTTLRGLTRKQILAIVKGQGITALPLPPKVKRPVIPHPEGTDLERAFDTFWRQFAPFAPTPVKHRFCESRKWEIDRAFVAYKVAVEIEGRGHQRENRFQTDMDKYNALAVQGWILIRLDRKRLYEETADSMGLVLQAITSRASDSCENLHSQ